MSAAYFAAAIPEPFRILGLQLKPLSLGRYRLMRRFDVAFVDEESKQAGMGDLILGILICSMRCDEFLAFMDSKGCKKEISRWMGRVTPWGLLGCLPIIGKFFARRNGFNVLEKIVLFKRYIDHHSQVPKYWNLEDDAPESGSHWSHGVEVVLRSELNWTKEEIDEQPLSKALSDYFKWCENKGQIRLMTAAEIQICESMEAANGV